MDAIYKGEKLVKEKVREWKDENKSKDPSASQPLVTF